MQQETGGKLEPADKKESDAKEVPAAAPRIPPAELADLVKEADKALAPVLMAMIAEYMTLEEFMQWATYSPAIFAACKTSLSQRMPSLQLQVVTAPYAVHTLMLAPTGEVFATGFNELGQLGVGDNKNRNVFTPVSLSLPGERVRQAATGTAHTLLLTTNDRVLAFGDNSHGQLGLGDNIQRNIPTPVPLTLLPEERVTQVAAGDTHTLMLTTHRVLACGNNSRGHLGVGDNVNRDSLTPVPVPLLPGERITQLATGMHTLLLTTHRLLAWGFNQVGQLGVRDNIDRNVPTPVPLRLSPGEFITQIAAGTHHTLVLTNQRVLACGNNEWGQLGEKDTSVYWHSLSPIRHIPLLPRERVKQVAAGVGHTLLLTTDNRILVFGNNQYGQLGVRPQLSSKLLSLSYPESGNIVAVTGFPDMHIKQMAAGQSHSLLLTTTNELFACGNNQTGQLSASKKREKAEIFMPVIHTPWQTSVRRTHAFLTRLPSLTTTIIDKTLESKSTQLDLSHYFLGEWDPLPLLPQIRALSPAVQEVNLANNRLHHWPIDTLIQVLQAFPNTVKRIILSHNDLHLYAPQLQPCLLALKWQGITVICDELDPKKIIQTTAMDSLPDLKLGGDNASASSSSSSSSMLSASSAPKPSSTLSITTSSSTPFTTATLSTPPTPAPSSTLSTTAILSTPPAIAEPPISEPQPTGTRAVDTSGPFTSIPPIKQIIDDLQNLFEMPKETVAQLLDSKSMAKKKPTATLQARPMPAEKKPINKNYRHWLTIHAEQTSHVPHACLAQLMTANLLIHKLRRNNPPKNSLAYTPPDLLSFDLLGCFDIYTQVCQTVNNIKDEWQYEVLANLQQLGSNLQAIIKLMPDNVLQDIASKRNQFDHLFNAVNESIQSDTTLKKGVENVTPCIAAFKPLPVAALAPPPTTTSETGECCMM